MADKLQLPAVTVRRLMKDAIEGEETVITSKNSVNVMTQLAGLFAIYLGSTANDLATENKLKTIQEKHVYEALEEIGLENYIDVIKQAVANSGSANIAPEIEQEEAEGRAEKRGTMRDVLDDAEEEIIETTKQHFMGNKGGNTMKVEYEQDEEMQE